MRLIAIFGPTAVGKTEVALALARRLRERGESPVAVSADALQVYKGLSTVTGVASAAERRELEHRLVCFLEVSEPFSAGRYAKLAHAEIDALIAAGRRPFVLGGTGLYLRAALTKLSLHPPPREGVRKALVEQVAKRGVTAMHAELAAQAPWAAAKIDPRDRQRVVRALELLAGDELREGSAQSPNELWSEQTRRPTLLIGLTMERESLYERIDARVEAMLAAGAREEVLRAHAAGASHTARKALGFQQLLDGDIEAMKRRTRNYARRQLTWMRKLGGVKTIDFTGRDANDVAGEIVGRLDDEDRGTCRNAWT